MKNLVIISILLTSSLTLACDSIDLTLKKYDVGLASSSDIAKTINCNLEDMYVRGLCNTKVGIKKDLLDHAIKKYNVGLVTKQDVENARKALNRVKSSCTK